MKVRARILLASAVLFSVNFYISQIREERLLLDRKREPEVEKIEKKGTSVEVGELDSSKESPDLEYRISHVPPVLNFETTPIQGMDVSPRLERSFPRNYFRIGYGNYNKFLTDANVSYELQDGIDLGVDIHHLSTDGLPKRYDWSSSMSDTDLSLYLNSYGEKARLNLSTDFSRKEVNYYGIYNNFQGIGSETDLKQTYTKFGLNAYYDFYSKNILDYVRLKSFFLEDHFNAQEKSLDLAMNFSEHGIDLSREDGLFSMNLDLGIGLRAVDTRFGILDKHHSSHFLLDFAPGLEIYRGDSYLKIGSMFSILNSNSSNENLPKEEENKFFWFPKLELLLAATDEIKFYTGIDGGLKFNSFSDLLEKNPFLISDLSLRPTRSKYRLYFGMKGDVDQVLEYDACAGFSKIHSALFFTSNGLIDNSITPDRKAYDYLNTFSVRYDDGMMNEVKGSLRYLPLDNLSLDTELKYMKYTLDSDQYAYYTPVLEVSLGARYSLLGKKLNFGLRAIAVTDRTANSFELKDQSGDYSSSENTNTRVPGYFDLNLSAEYKIYKNISIFAAGSNLLGGSYQHYLGYRVLGAQFMGGFSLFF